MNMGEKCVQSKEIDKIWKLFVRGGRLTHFTTLYRHFHHFNKSLIHVPILSLVNECILKLCYDHIMPCHINALNITSNFHYYYYRLKIPSYDVEFVREYWIDVFEPFIEAYKTGVLTPNPDVYCNRHIKFHKFRNYALDTLGVDRFATGHYVRIEDTTEGKVRLLRGIDSDKDQSYFLSMTPVSSYSLKWYPRSYLNWLLYTSQRRKGDLLENPTTIRYLTC